MPGVEKIKVRSSANAEDIPNFDGAGLHDSFAADTDQARSTRRACRVEDDDDGDGDGQAQGQAEDRRAARSRASTRACGTQRAIEERSFARIDHATVAMGLAIVAAYDTESDVAANAVVVTRVLNTDGRVRLLAVGPGAATTS